MSDELDTSHVVPTGRILAIALSDRSTDPVFEHTEVTQEAMDLGVLMEFDSPSQEVVIPAGYTFVRASGGGVEFIESGRRISLQLLKSGRVIANGDANALGDRLNHVNLKSGHG